MSDADVILGAMNNSSMQTLRATSKRPGLSSTKPAVDIDLYYEDRLAVERLKRRFPIGDDEGFDLLLELGSERAVAVRLGRRDALSAQAA